MIVDPLHRHHCQWHVWNSPIQSAFKFNFKFKLPLQCQFVGQYHYGTTGVALANSRLGVGLGSTTAGGAEVPAVGLTGSLRMALAQQLPVLRSLRYYGTQTQDSTA